MTEKDFDLIEPSQAINEIAEILTEWSGEGITEIYKKVSGKDAFYAGDNLIAVKKIIK